MAFKKTNTVNFKTPEGVQFSFQLASPITRFLAYSVDFVLILFFTSTTGTLIGLLGLISVDLIFAVRILYFFIVSIGYGVLLEWLFKGQTLGKKLLRLRVMDIHGLKLQFSQILIRNLFRMVDRLPVFYLLGGIVCFFSNKAQRLGDFAANTVVIKIQRVVEPELTQILPDKYNSFRDYPHLEARLRQSISPEEAGLAIQALYRRNQLEPIARIDLFREMAQHFKSIVEFPQEATDGISDEQYIRNVVDILFRDSIKITASKS